MAGLFFQHLSGILSMWICWNLQLLWFSLSYLVNIMELLGRKCLSFLIWLKISCFLELSLGFGISRIFHFTGNGKREKLQNPGNFPGKSVISREFPSREIPGTNPSYLLAYSPDVCQNFELFTQKGLSYFQKLELFFLKNPWVIFEMLKNKPDIWAVKLLEKRNWKSLRHDKNFYLLVGWWICKGRRHWALWFFFHPPNRAK